MLPGGCTCSAGRHLGGIGLAHSFKVSNPRKNAHNPGQLRIDFACRIL
jgi:hypothetical protein